MGNLEIKPLSRNIGANMVLQAVATVLGLLTYVLIARFYGAEGNGKYAVALLLPSVLGTILNLGVAPANVYHLGSGQISVRHLIRANLSIFSFLAPLGVVLGITILFWKGDVLFPGVSAIVLYLALAIFPILLFNGFLLSIFQGFQDFRKYNLLQLIQPLTLLVLITCILITGNREIIFVVAAQLAAVLLVLALSIVFLFRIIENKKEDELPERFIKKTLSYGWKAHLSNILAFFNYKADIFLVNWFMGPSGAGVYVISVALSERLWIISRAVSTVLLPRLSQLSNEEEKRKILTPLIARHVFFLTILAALCLAAIAIPLVHIFFGLDFVGAVLPLWILLCGIVLTSASRVLANDIAARGRPELNMYTSAVVVLVNIAGNLVLIPEYGLPGAASATTLAYALNLVCRLAVYTRISGNTWTNCLILKPQDLRNLSAGIGRLLHRDRN